MARRVAPPTVVGPGKSAERGRGSAPSSVATCRPKPSQIPTPHHRIERHAAALQVFTRDFSAAHRVAGRLEAGQVHINGAPLGGVETPFGGYKQSGMGREKGLEALAHYTQTRTVIARIDPA